MCDYIARIMSGNLADYRVSEAERLLTPALLVYPDLVNANIAATLRVMGGDANRWRPHLKTAKMPWVIRCLIAHGVTHFKCATTRELLVACESGARDVLIAYPVVGANARRVAEIAQVFPGVRISVLAENVAQVELWRGAAIGIFVDVNPGMNRTGVGQDAADEIAAIARAAGSAFRGVHYYDGHVAGPDRREREAQAHAGYERLLAIVSGLDAGEVITSGTPTFPYAVTFAGFTGRGFTHRASPGTVVFGDMTSLAQLPEEFGYRAAALVLATVVSHPTPRRITCDAGHKSVSADAGVPTCAVVGRPELAPLKPSEEHLPIDVPEGVEMPEIGSALYLLPRHVCPTVNQFDAAVLVRGGRVDGLELVAARGHEPAMAGGR